MTVALQSALVRIWDNDDHIIGAGFLVTESHVLTCAHVVSDALDKPRQEMPTGPVQLDFPFVKAGERVTAVVTLWQPKRPDSTGDIAGLELQASPPDGARPLRLVSTPDTWNHPFRAFGFPVNRDLGVWASGVLRDRTVNGHIHIEDTKTTGYSVQPGFSGTAVWDETLHGVIGMAATAESKTVTKAAFIIPTDKLVEAWPDLRAWAMPPNPYRGLQAFRQEDADLFFGRETFVGQLATAVARKPFVAVIGASGSGKSSVVFAGLLPRVGSETAVVTFRPGSQPFRALADALLPVWQPELPGNERLEEAGKLAANLQAGKTQLSEVVNDILQRQPMWKRLLLVADQFEELYTLCPQPEVKRAFVRCLVTAVQAQAGQHSPDLTLLLTMRADFMGQATEERPLADALQNATYILGPMTREELATAVEKPARVASVQFEPGLVARILDDVGEAPGNLPLLEFALTLLWEQQSNGLLTHTAYEAIGEVEGALAQYAEDQFGGLSQPEQEQARFIFTQLVQPGRGTEDTRRQATMSEIGAENWGLVKWLADARLVVTNRNEAGEETAEIVHEVLTRRWLRVRGWMNEDRRFREWQERLREAMRQWRAAKEDEAALLRGTLLAEADGWLAERSGQLPAKECAYIEKSIEFSERTRLTEIRRRNVILAVSLLATVLFAVLGLFSYGQSQDLAVEGTRAAANEGTAVAESTRAFQNEATAVYNEQLAVSRELEALNQSKIAESRALAAFSLNVQEDNLMRGLLLAIAAGQIGETDQAFDALHGVLSLVAYPQYTLQQGNRYARGAVWNTDESKVLTWGTSHDVQVWDGDTGTKILQLTHTEHVPGASWNSAESQILTWSDDGTVRIWDATTGLEQLRLNHEEQVYQALWNKEESEILTLSGGIARIWNVETGMERLKFEGESVIRHAIWNSNESLILTSEYDGIVKLWDSITGEEKLQLQSNGSAAWNKDESRILTWGDNLVQVWDTTTGEELLSLVHESLGTDPVSSRILHAVWNNDESQILTWTCAEIAEPGACYQGIITVWDAKTGVQRMKLAHDGMFNNATWNGEESLLLTWSDNVVQIWDARTGEEQMRFTHSANILGAMWNGEGSQILAWSGDGIAKLWDISTRQEQIRLTHDNWINGATWNSDESRVLTWSEDGIVRIWNITKRAERLELLQDYIYYAEWNQDKNQLLVQGCDGEVARSLCTPKTVRLWDNFGTERVRPIIETEAFYTLWDKNQTQVLTAGYDRSIKVWNAETGEELQHWQLPVGQGIGSSMWNSDGSKILSWGYNGTVRILDVTTGEEVLLMPESVTGAAWSKNESQVLTWSHNDGTATSIWDATTGERQVLFSDTGRLDGAVWNEDGSLILAWNKRLRIWDAKTSLEQMQLLSTFGGEVSARGALWNKDESQVLSWGDTVRVWDVATGIVQLELKYEGSIYGAKWNNYESELLTWSWDGTARVWDGVTGVERLRFTHEGEVTGALWNENESQIMTWSKDGKAKVWDSTTGRLLFSLTGDGTPVIIAQWSQDGKQILFITEGGLLRIINTQMKDLLEIACTYTIRDLTIQEWQLYFPDQPYRKICE